MFNSPTKVLAAVTALVLAALVWSKGTALAIAGVHGYQHYLAPAAARVGGACRFEPSCSRYAEIVITRDGIVSGGWKAMRRLAKCGPWTPRGTRDDP